MDGRDYALVEELLVDDLYEYWENKVPYSARVFSINTEGNCVRAVVALKGGLGRVEFTKGTKVRLLVEEDHWSDETLVAQKKATMFRGIPID